MKKTLLSLLTTVAFAAPTFAADAQALNVTPTEASSAQKEAYPAEKLGDILSKLTFNNPEVLNHITEAMDAGFNMWSATPEFSSFIHFSAGVSNFKIFTRFLAVCLGAGFDLDAQNESGVTLLHMAARNTDPEIARYLITLGSLTKVECVYTYHPEKPVYPLFFAVLSGR